MLDMLLYLLVASMGPGWWLLESTNTCRFLCRHCQKLYHQRQMYDSNGFSHTRGLDCMKCGNGTIKPGQVCTDDWASNCQRCYVKGKLDCSEPRCRRSKVLAVENGCLKTSQLNELAQKDNDCYDEKVGDRIVRMCLCPNDFCNHQFEAINEQFEHGRPQKATEPPATNAPAPLAAPEAAPPQQPAVVHVPVVAVPQNMLQQGRRGNEDQYYDEPEAAAVKAGSVAAKKNNLVVAFVFLDTVRRLVF